MAPIAAGACAPAPAREYPLQGQVIAIDPARQEITIAHEDIPKFMPGMTMPFAVRDATLLDGLSPGDLVTATLVVEENSAHLRALKRTGAAPLPEGSAPPPRSTLLGPGDLAPDARFVDERGVTRRLADWKGSALALTFIYTRCPVPTFCPLMDRQFRAVQDHVRADPALRSRVRLLSISFDPEHDTPAVLARHAAGLKADPSIWHFLTMARADLDAFAPPFGVSIVRDGESAAEIVHNLRTAVIDPAGRVTKVFNGAEWTPEDLIAELRQAHAGR